jgi:rRNA small subunit pseudouridine methyltransferase Nep1
MVGVEDRNEDVAEEEAPGPSSVPDAAAPAPVPAPSAEDGGVIFVLEKASLEAAKVGKNYQLLNCDDHATFLKKHKRDPALYRPDILHQALLAILDSTLNKAGRLKGLYVHTEKNVLIQINPHIRIPRTFKRFCGLMCQ